mgnify:CR=1 FL=1
MHLNPRPDLLTNIKIRSVLRPIFPSIQDNGAPNKKLPTHLLLNILKPNRQILEKTPHSLIISQQSNEIIKPISISLNFDTILYPCAISKIILNIIKSYVSIYMAEFNCIVDSDILQEEF